MNKKIKILYLTTASKLSGTEKMLYELVKGIDKEKYEVMVCTIKDDLSSQLLDRLRKKGIKTACLNLDKKWKVWRVFKLLKIIKNFNPDVLQSFLFFDNILARIFGKLARIQIIISGQRSAETCRSRIRNFFDKITINFADYMVSNSEAGKKIVIKRDGFPEEKIKVIYNGIDLDKTRQLETKKSKKITKIGFVGRLRTEKGLNYLIEAVVILKNKINDFVVLTIGEGPERENLEKLVCKNGVENLICFLGYKEKAWKYMQKFDLLVLPSLWEGFPNVIIEAMVQNVLVVATRVGGVPELIEDNETGFLVEPRDSKALAEKINYVLSLPEEGKKKIMKNARKTVKENFFIEKMVKEYEKLYENLIPNN